MQKFEVRLEYFLHTGKSLYCGQTFVRAPPANTAKLSGLPHRRTVEDVETQTPAQPLCCNTPKWPQGGDRILQILKAVG